MATAKNPVRQRMCKHLRSKEMFHSAEMKVDDQFHSGIFWCNDTLEGTGPDGSCADHEDCGPGRSCFEE